MPHRPSARRDAAEAAESNAPVEEASTTSAPRGGGRVSNERALYFARGEAPPTSRRRTSNENRANGPTSPQNGEQSWPGYYATARDLGEQRRAAQEARQEQLERLANGEEEAEEKPVWVPRIKPRSSVLTADRVVPRLQELALMCLARHVELLPTLEYIDADARHRVARAVVKLRRMKPEVLPLFLYPGVTEIDIPDCSYIDESAFLEALQECTSAGLSLTILRLGLCGRSVSDSVILELGDSLRSVEQLKLSGCYRLSDTGVEALVRRCAPSLQEFELSCNQRITKTAIDYFGELQHLHSLSLSECPQLDDSALQALFTMKNLRKLELNQMERISDEFVGELTAKLPDLEDLSLARCSQLSDVAVRAAFENCRNLRHLDVSDLPDLTDDSVEPIRRLGHSLKRVTIGRCLGLTDVAIEHIAIGANNCIERLVMSSLAEITDAAIFTLQKHCLASLETLDISFCRNITEDALGIFTDEAEQLKSLILWGCTQITARFLTSHSRDELITTGHPLLTGLTVKY
ncbi:hypothetical protein Poli38472_003024 [Pythium oligandrum]|uniref:F-box/LRR-repeat protein 15-like leucin rich repeat domain-containing protein n=1 Tax=Pythium oligandrum TaxID=41045 RepID=A0A8K1C5S7_PYTOL|nr:hypothetical protein Poli38472_003024 [Pythium oligandrum]|eukprot:TMW57099.1 hypothetical protein Poli38472_003024 [Pythium oligandrum]